ncbi:MAG: pilus assembly protein [Anaerolineales bacterium]|nr:pilus assembly protein [Anaerolineales bacterium]
MLFHPREKGQGFLEYGMLIVLIAVIVILVLSAFGRAVDNIFSNIIVNV